MKNLNKRQKAVLKHKGYEINKVEDEKHKN